MLKFEFGKKCKKILPVKIKTETRRTKKKYRAKSPELVFF